MPNPWTKCTQCSDQYEEQEELRLRAERLDKDGQEYRSRGLIAEAERCFTEARELISQANRIFDGMQAHADQGHPESDD